MKKSVQLKIYFIFLLNLLLVKLVSAQPSNLSISIMQFILDTVSNVINYIIVFGAPIFIVIIGEYGTSEFFFVKILLFILLFIILRLVIDKTPFGEDNEKISLIISLIISILGIRFINQNGFFEGIFIQYGVLSAAITTLLPMIMFFYFVQNTKLGTYGRKFAWALYIILFTGILFSRYETVPPEIRYIYFAAIATAFLLILFDKSIKTHLGLAEFNKSIKAYEEESIRALRRKLGQYAEDNRNGIMTDAEYNELKKKILKSIKRLS